MHPFLVTPAHIAGDGFAFGLSEGCEQSGHHFAGHGCGVDVFFFKAHPNPQRLQLPNRLQTFLGVAGKSGDGLYQHSVDQPSAAVCKESLEILSLFSRCAGDALVGVYVHHAPIFLAGDQAGVVRILCGEGVELVIRSRTDTGVGSDSQFHVLWLFRILLGYDGKLLNHANDLKQCTVFFNNLVWPGGAIRHMGDNLTGAGDGDDEQIFVDLQNVPYEIGTIVFAVNIYEALNRNQHFGMIRNAFIRVVDYERNIELCRFNLNENYNNMTALIAGALMRTDNGWEFLTDGNAARVESLVNVVAAFAD